MLPSAPLTSASCSKPSAMASHVPISEEVVRTCVTPGEVKGVQSVLESKKEPHRCAVKLLPYFFTRQQLGTSNTEGSYNKESLDTTKLNSL